jgi:hypothetical protein
MITSARLVAVTLALAVAPTVAMAATGGGPVRGAHYKGTVGPGYPVTFHVSANGKHVTDLVVAFEETCNGAGPPAAPKFHFKTLTIKAGKFTGSSTEHYGPKASDALHITGHFDGRKAMGKVSDRSKITSLPTCTETEPFTAKVKK